MLGFEGLTSEMLLYMIESVMNADGDGEGEQGGSEEVERRMDGLVAAIVAGIERKRELQRLDGMLCRLNELVDGQNGAQDEKWVRVAKGGILLKRHERMGIQEVREHVRKVGEGGADAEMMAVLVEEMKVAEGVVKTELFEFLGGMLEKEGVRLVRRLEGEMGALCERDVGLFGRYLRLLLMWKGQGSGAGDRDKAIDLIVEGKISIRQAAVERIQKGWVGEEEVRKWINDLIDRRG